MVSNCSPLWRCWSQIPGKAPAVSADTLYVGVDEGCMQVGGMEASSLSTGDREASIKYIHCHIFSRN